jgi:hypothetical protein
VEQEQRTTEEGVAYQVTAFAITTDAGEMRNFEVGPGRYLNLVGSSRARDLRRMTISATGSGDRDIFVSYISEVLVWKSTYRIILPDKPNQKPLLQGWAIVDNTIGEDWKDVQLSLIAGAPQSFIQDISQPQYARRPVVALPQSMMLTPQTHEATMKEGEAVMTTEVSNGAPAAASGPAGGIGGIASGSGADSGQGKAYSEVHF